jgi:hypothetical protein
VGQEGSSFRSGFRIFALPDKAGVARPGHAVGVTR